MRIKTLVKNNKRVVISNVQPIIPNDLIIEALMKIGINIISNISELRASSSKPGRSHIMSFRRKFYIKEDDERIIPESLQLTHNNTNYWTYLTTDFASCFVCKQAGHVSKACPSIKASSELDTQICALPTTNSNISADNLRESNQNVLSAGISIEKPVDSQSDNEDKIKTQNPEKIEKAKRKKLLDSGENSNDGATIEQSLLPAKGIFDEASNSLPLTLSQFTEFLEKSFSDAKGYQKALRNSNDIPRIIEIIDKVYVYTEEKKMKSKFTRLKNKLKLIDPDNP